MEYWAKPGLDRHQTLLFSPTLDACVSEHHPVRLLDEILRARDWSAWKKQYDGRRGQPPIPPWVLAGVILYGLMRRIRSSRQLEYACTHNLDFLWLAEGRTIDHDTLCKFRTKFKEPLKDLFKQIGRVAMTLGLIQLLEVAFDGTRVKANASRMHTWTAEKVQKALEELEAEAGRLLAEAEATDVVEATLWGEGAPQALPPELAEANQRREKLRETLKKLDEADAARKQEGIDPKKNPAQLPRADTDSKIMPNKEGGYAPNYTPLAAADGANGFLVDCDVIAGPNEQSETLATVERIEANFGRKPEKLLADAAHGTGANLAGMEQRQIDFYTPIESPAPQEGNPAKREDPRRPVADADWPRLPRNDRKKLAKSCFVYDAEADLYYCPMGQTLRYEETKKERRGAETVHQRVYRCRREGCPLADQCVESRSKRGRSLRRDEHEPRREAMGVKLQTAEGKAIYNRRMHLAETPFAAIKAILGVRRFLLRGLEKVRTEWRWVCTAYNLKKLVAAVAALRAKKMGVPAGAGG